MGSHGGAYRGETGPDYDRLLDELADVCESDDPTAIAELYDHDDLHVPPHLESGGLA